METTAEKVQIFFDLFEKRIKWRGAQYHPSCNLLFCIFAGKCKGGTCLALYSSNCPLCLFTEPNHQGYHELKETTPFSHY